MKCCRLLRGVAISLGTLLAVPLASQPPPEIVEVSGTVVSKGTNKPVGQERR